MLLLDQAEYRMDNGPWQPREEVLRVDNLLREALGYPLNMAAFPQPWTLHGQGRREEHRLGLRFTVRSQLALEGVKLAVERPQDLRVRWNGQPVSCQSDGWFTDEAIRTLPLPPVRSGENILELEMPYGPATNVEWCYLLGDFGVTVAGACAQLTPPVRELAFGDWTAQGLPFYAGNVTYHCTLDTAPGTYQLEATKYRAPLVQVRLDGRLVGSPVSPPIRWSWALWRGPTSWTSPLSAAALTPLGPCTAASPSPGAGRTPGARRGLSSAMSTSSPPAVCLSPPSCSAWRAEPLPGPQDEQAAGGLRRLACFCSFHRWSWGRLALGHCPNRRLYWREKLDRSEKPAKEAASVTA